MTLRKTCPYTELLWSVFFRIWTEYGELRSISPYSVQIRENTDQNNSEYERFLRNVTDLSIVSLDIIVMINILQDMVTILHKKKC